MPDIKNNIKVIYNALAKEGYNDLGSEQEFAESMADENNRKLVYNTLKGKEFADVKDYDSFSNMVYQQPRAEQQQEEEIKPVKPAKIDPRFVAPNVGKPTDAQPIMKSVQQDTGFTAPQDYNSQNAFLSNVDKDYNVASHIPDAQQPIKMYGADSNLGEVIDNLYTVYDEAYKKDNPKKIAEAANMARSMGLDNEQAEKALTLVHGLYSQNVANNIADYMYSRMNNGDPLYALKEVYYDKDFQKKLKDTTTRLGLDNTQGFVEYYLKPALQRKLENERGFTDTVNFGVQSGSDDVAKNTEVFEKRKAEEDLLQKQVDAMNAEGKRIEEKGQQMYDPNYKNRPWWADLIPVEGGGRSAYDEAEGIKRNPEAEELMRTGQAMQRMADDAQAAISEDNILRTRKTDGLTNQIKNAFGRILRGGAKTATDIRTWDFGFTDLKDATVIKAAADAYANNRATAAQKALLNAVTLKNAVMGKHGDALGGLYGAAGTTIQMAPYMMQFAASPVKGVGVGFQKYCRTQLEKAFGKYATEAVGKFVIKSGELAGRFVGDVAQGAAMTTIFNMPAVAADTHKRMTGDLEATTDSKGNIVYSGKRTNVKSGGRAFAEAFTAQTIENQSELFGEYLKPLANFTQKGAAKAMDKWGLSKTKDFLTGINNKQIMKSFNRFTKNTEWNGLFGEVGEEIVGNFENAFTVGDLNLNLDINDDNSVFSKKVNTDIILGVGLGCGIISGARVGSYIRNNRKLNTAINDADSYADVIFGTDRWQQIKSEIDNAPDDKAGNLLQSYIDSEKLNKEQKQTIVDYTVNTYIKRGNDISQLKNAIEDNISSEQQEVQSAYENGQNARDAQMNEVKTSLDEAEKHAAELLGEDELNALDGVEDVDAFKESNAYKSYSEEQRETALKYIIARTAYNGMINRVQDEIKAAVNKANAEIDNLTHKDSGTIIRATLKNGDQEVYVVSGNVAMSPDGKSIDTEKSDNDIVVYNTESGKKEMLNIKDLQSVDTPIDAATYKANNAAETTQQIAETEAAKIDGVRNFHYNDTVKVQDKDGNLIDGSVQDVTPDGIIVVSDAYPGGKTYTAAELTAMQPQPQTVAENATVEQQAEEAVADNESNEAPVEEKGEANSPQSEATQQEETTEPQQQTAALERIPKDESGQPLYEQTDPETAWDAIVEQTEGDTNMAQAVTDDMVSDLEDGVKKAERTKTKSGGSIAEKIAAEKERAAAIERAKATLAHWRKIAAVNRMREAAIQAEEQRKADERTRVRKEEEEKARVDQEEAERIKRETLNGVPDFIEDKAPDARARGYRRVNGDKVDRQEPIDATIGKEVQVKFDDDNIPTGHVAIIEANQLQPSHKNGQRNPQHFIDEAQPKERKDDASVGAARKIAANIRPEEITSSVTAYTGAPTVNSRGEVIQGNNRSAALREMWDNHQEQGDKYKQYLIDNAKSFGLKAEDIAAMDKPVLVNMLDVNDEQAISLGQFVASDTESGGTERIKPKNVVKKLGDKMKNFTNILLRTNDENVSFAELVDSNGANALKWLNTKGVISPTQYKSAFDSKGNLTAEAKNDIKGIMYQSIFEGGNTQLEEMFYALPAKAQKAILATAYRDYDSPQSERMIEDIQNSIMAYYALSHDSMFMNAKNHKEARIAVEAWRRQLAFDDVTGESYLPAEKYSNFALLLATMYKGDNQSLIQGTFNRLYDLIQGTQEKTLFEQPDNTPRTLVQAIKETLNIKYDGQQRSNVLAGDSSASQEGRTGSNGDATPGGRGESIDGAEANQGGTEADSGEGRPIADTTKTLFEYFKGGIKSLIEKSKEQNNSLIKAIVGSVTNRLKEDLHNRGIDITNDYKHTIDNNAIRHALNRHGGEKERLQGQLPVTEEDIENISDVINNYDDINIEENKRGQKNIVYKKSYPNGFTIYIEEVRTGRKELAMASIRKKATLTDANSKTMPISDLNNLSVGKDKKSSNTKQANNEKKSEHQEETLFEKAERIANEGEQKSNPTPRKDGESITDYAERVAEEHQAQRIRKEEEAKVDTNPTEAQKEAGNYKKGHIKVDGLDITIEQPKGSIRRGTDANGKQWESEMHNTYGYIRGTESVDGDHIDIFLSDNPTEGNVFVVDQINKDGSFDEHKVMYGFSDMESARQAYLSNYEEGWQGLGNITEVSKEDFKAWIDSSKRKTKPFAEYTSVKTQGDVQAKKPTEIPHLTEKEKREQRKQELRNKIKVKLRGQLNVGVDPELFMMGVELASMEIEDGVRKFADFTKKMIAEIGDEIRPYLKSIYNGARDLPGMEELSEEMTPYEEVKAFNIATIGDKGEEVKPSVLDTAEQINNEQTVERSAKEEVKNTVATQDVDNEAYSITKQHNNKKDIDIWVVRGKERTDSDAFKERKQVAKKYNGYYSSFRGVNGFVFNSPEDAQSFADKVFDAKDEQINTETNENYAHNSNEIIRKDEDGDASNLLTDSHNEKEQSEKEAELHGLKVGDKVLYKGKEATIFDFDNGRPVLDTGLAPVVYEVVDMEAVKPIEKQEQTKTNVKEDLTEEKTEAKAKEANNKTVSSHAEGNLFDTDTAPTESLTNKEKENEVHLSTGETATKRERGHEPRQNEPMGESKQNEAQRPDGRRMDRRDTAHISTDTERGGGVPNVSEGKQRLNSNNNHGERGVDYAPTSIDARIEANIQAIELAKKLTENGEKATPQQMEILRKFSGWGGLGKAFNENPNGAYGEINKTPRILKELLGEEAYNNAIESANSSYYTPTHIIDTLWDIAEKLGFKGGRILEGSAGIGNIIAQIPTHISENSNIHAVEKDPTAGSILSLLYPDAKVDIQGFEETSIPNGSIDLAITNVPFVTGLRVWDTTSDKDLSKKFHDIHNFCIAKNIRKLREGGIGIFISSNGTLDNSQQIRNWVVNDGNADFIGAFRLNNKTFLGTSVTSDIIVVRKRVNGKKSAKAIDVSEVSGERIAEFNTGEVKKVKGKMIPVIKDLPMDYNKYFIEHPEKMAGVMEFAFEHGDTYRPTTKQLYPTKDKPQDKLLEEFVNSFSIDTEEQAQNIDNEQGINNSIYEELGSDVKEGSMVVSNGELCVAQYGQAVPLKLNANKVKGRTKQECFKSYTDIKQALNDVLAYETQNADDKGLQPLLDKLNKAYDDFVNTYGHLNKNTSISFLRNDIDFSNILALETYKEENDENNNRVKVYGKTDVFSKRVVTKETEPKPDNVKDGVIVSIYKNGRIDIPYISKQLNMSEDAVKNEIINSGLGFENPVSKEIEVSYKYLSGNVREKLQQAEENNENGEYSNNINALKKVIPANIPAHLIEFNLGSSWVTPKLYEEYIKNKTGLDVTLIPVDGTWVMKAPLYGLAIEQNRSMGVYSKLKGETILGHELIEAAIQNKTITISKTRKDWDGKKETIVDKDATQACNSRIDEIRQDFKDWARGKVQSDVELSQELEKIYNDKFNNYVAPTIPEEFIPERFGGAAQNIKLRPHQAQAVVRGTTQPLILAHEVGTGKTFTLISTAMEMRRLGTARKPMIVVQNATVGQFVASAKALYPNAKILTLENSDRGEDGRRRFYAKIRYNDWDMIVVPQSTFEFIPDSKDRQITFIKDKVDEKLAVLQRMKEANNEGDDFITRRVEKEISQLQSEIAALIENNESEQREKKATASELKKKEVAKKNTEAKAKEMLDRRTDDVEDFDELGIDALLVDEAHEYKHLGFATAMQRGVKGVDPSYSKKAQSVFLKTQAVLSKNNGRNVIFATGTPISNTAAEIWTFMRYLMPADTMKEYGIYYFDDFVRNFGNIQQMLEFTTSGKFKENNRFAGYINLPELARIWSSVADIVLTRDQKKLKEKIPEIEGGKAQDIYLPQTKSLRSVMKYVKDQLTIFENMSGAEKKENTHIPLTMYGIAKAAAVDARLVDATAEDDVNSKTNEAVRQTLQSLKDTNGYKGTVAIFADVYQNKAFGFNLYEDIKKKLIEKGVPEKEIFVMKPGMTINKKLEIFNKVNSGEIRVILGSTFTLGTGVNIQERLHTLIHLDAPNRPMDYTQRNGRILRQGNIHKEMNKPVRILRFGVEDSLDVTAYQRLKTKGAIADSIMNSKQLIENSMENRELEEEADLFGDTVAQLSGSEYAMLKNQAEKEVRKYESKKRQWEADQTYIHNAKPRLKGQISKAEQLLEDNNASLKAVKETFPNGKFNQITIGKQQFDSIEAMTDFIKDYNKKINEESNKLKEKANANYNSQMVVNIDGLEFTIHLELAKETANKGVSLFSKVTRKMYYSQNELGLKNVPIKQGLLRNGIEDILNNVITGHDFAERIDTLKQSIAQYKSDLELILARDGKPFEFKNELETAKQKLEEYTEAMKEELEEKEKKYAAMDSEIKTATNIIGAEEAEDEDSTESKDTKDDILYRTVFGGNSGYVGYSMSKRAVEAKEEGRYPKTEFRREYHITAKSLDMLTSLGFIDNSEWHHTSMYGNKTPFYGWAEDELADDYLKHKKEIDTLCKGIDPKTKQSLIEKVEKPQYEHEYEMPQYGEAETAANSIREWRHKQIEKYDQFTGFKGYADATEEEKKERDAYLHSINEQMEEKIREMLAKDYPDYLAAKNALDAYNNYEEDLRKAIGERIKEYLDIDKYSQRWREQTTTTQPTANTETLTNHAESVVQNLHLNNVEIVPDGSSLNGEQATAKGFYNKRTGKIVVVAGNHTDIADIEKTVLHEAVAHHGLRELFGDNFDNFLDTVFAKADIETRQQIAHLSAKHGWNIRTATEEYLASMAEDTNFEQIKPTLWQRIKQLFGEIMSAFGLHHANITDNDLRYILWRSYKNLQNSGKHSILDKAEDIAMQYRLKAGNYADKATDNVLYRSSIDPTATEVLPDARTRYEKETKEPDNIDSVPKTHNFFRRFYKSYVDSMLALKSFTNSVLEATGDKMASHEDTYKAENAMTSKNKTDGEVYNRDYYNPLLTAAQQLCEAVGMDYDALNMYMVAKHGLERNEYMGKRAAQNDENVLKAKKSLEDALAAYNEDPTSENETAVQKAQEKYSKVYDKALEVHTNKDYSGLTELTGKEDVAEAEYEAQKIVDAVETSDVMPKVTAFWSKVNAATKQTLKTGYESGIMTKDTYEHILNMYKYYIPLRGWAKPTADDVYTYYNNRSYEGKPLTKTAKGRTSLAEDPMAIIASMAQHSIIEANRNKMKQTFLNFVLNHPTSLATVGEQWYIKNALGEWERSDANIPANATPDEISKIIEEHELEMQRLAEQGTAIKQRNGLKLDKRVINGEGEEHTIKVWRGGKEYVIYINGNPAVAQAVNGLTNPDTQGSDLPKWAKIGAAQLKNFLSGVYTSFSPAFVLTNFTRDQLFASQAVYIKYGLKYKRQASKNARNLLFSGALPRLVYKWEHGTLNMNDETERYFDEFMRGGGETGFTALRDIESIKKEVKDAINGNKANIAKRGWKSFINAVEFANRSAEDFSRFVTFMTSRQQGKSIVDAIYDAKDITVNFNKKGSGEMGSRFMNFAYIFFNAAVQSINNFGTMLKQHPARTMLIISKFGALGFGVPMLNAFLTALCGGGDDDKYWDNMDWVRRNNIVLRIPFLEKTFISIPLPQELRPFYGMGEIAASILFGKETFSSGLQKAVEGFTGLLPIDFTGNGGNLPITLTPTVLQPVAQYMFNTDYFGRKVYNDNENKKFAPGWTKAFSSTPPVLIEATKFLNSLTGGNDVDSGGVNLNPDVINHFVKGYFGGPATFVTQMSSLLYKGFSGDAKEIRWRDVPVASRFVQQLDERSVRSSAQGSYKDFKEETEETEYRLSNYKKQVKMGKMEYAKMITDLIKSPEYQRYKIAKAYKKPMDLLKEALNHIDNTTDKKEVEKALTGLRHYMMETVESEQKGKHAKREEDFNYLGDNLSELNNNLKSSLRSLKRNEEQRLDGEEDDGIEELISEDKETTMRIIREMNKLFKKK